MLRISLRDHYVHQVPTGLFSTEHSQLKGSPDSFILNGLYYRLEG